MVEIDFGLKLECTQKTFQRCFNVVIWFTWHHNEGQRQINIETTLCISALECTTSSNVEPTLCISMLIWTILDYLETTLSFSTSSFTTLVNVETMLWKWAFPKRTKKKIISEWIHWIQSFHYFFTSHVKRNVLKKSCRAAKILKRSWKILHRKKLIWTTSLCKTLNFKNIENCCPIL